MMNRNMSATLVPLILIVATLVLPISKSNSAEGGFADDFSVDSTRYVTRQFDNASGIFSIDYVDGYLRMSTTGNEVGNGNINLDTHRSTERFSAKVTLSSESELQEQPEFSASTVSIQGYFYNDTQDAQNTPHNEGDVWVSLSLRVDQFGNTSADYCLSRINASGQQLNLDDFGTEFCNQLLEPGVLELDTKYPASIELDRSAGVLTITLGETSKQLNVTGDIYPPLFEFQRIQVWQNGAPGTAVAHIHGITTDSYSDDFSLGEPVFDRYDGIRNDAQATTGVVNERLEMTVTSQPETRQWSSIRPLGFEEYLESQFTLSTASTIGQSGGRIGVQYEYVLYNDTQDGGFDGRTGDVRALIYTSQRSDGRKIIEYCLQRADDADINNRSGLLGDGRDCRNFPVLLELGKTYRASIELDRTIPAVRFRLDGFLVEVPVTTGMFIVAAPRVEVGVHSRNDSTVIVHFDNLRTTPNAVTASEVASGVAQAPAFPDTVDIDSIQVDSTIAHPFDFSDYSPRVDFIDDFSGTTTDFGFHSGRDRGNAGVSWRDGAVVLETNSFADNDDGNWTEFYFNQPTDSLEAVVSLSSESRLPPTDRTEAQIQIRAVFYNDTQDYGFNDQEGDIEAIIQIRQEGDGRRQIGLNLRRRDENGSTGDDLLNDVAAVREGIESIAPNMDQKYRIRVSLDRENSVLRYSVDDDSYEYAIPSGIFLPARLRTFVSVNHNGPSGVAVGKIHSIKTDTIDEDFSLAPPLLAPYSPMWNTQRPGRYAEVIDGRLRLEADANITSGRDPGVSLIRASDYVGALLELSSESIVQPDGRVHVEVHGVFYNDLAVGQQEGSSEGRVFSTVRLTADGSGERYVQYCAFRSNDADFDDATELLGGDVENCPRFSFEPELDTPYKAYLSIDQEAATLTYGFNDETFVYNIPTSIGEARPFQGTKARTTDGSKVVAWVDDLSFSADAVPLSDSASALVVDVSDTTGTTDNGVSNGGSSGGGCTISRSSAVDPLLPAMFVLSMLFLGFRQRRE